MIGAEKAEEHHGAQDDEQRRWLGKINARDFFDMVYRPYNNETDLKRLCTQTFSITSNLTNVIQRLNKYYEGKVPFRSSDGGKGVFTDPYQDKRYIRDLKDQLLLARNEWMKGLDPISQMAARDLGLRDLPLPFEDLNPLFFLKPLSGGQLLLVIGEKGTGKTDWALTLAVIAINAGWVVISNIGLRYNVENYIFCQNFSSMLLAMCRAKLGIGTSDGKPKRVLLVLDEAGIQFASQQVSTGTFKQLDKFAKLFRKFGVDWVYITQYGTQVPLVFRMNYGAWHEKHKNKKSMTIVLNAGGETTYRSMQISEIPPTTLPFNTEHISHMEVDISIEEILTYLSNAPPEMNQFQLMETYLVAFIKRKMDAFVNQQASIGVKEKPMDKPMVPASKKKGGGA